MLKKLKIDLDFYNKLNKEHLEGKSLKELCKEYDIKFTTLYYGFKRNNLKIIKATNIQRKRIICNHNFFENIDCEIKAYLLGWIMSDGYINKRLNKNHSSRLGIGLKEEDYYILNYFQKFISNSKLSKITNIKNNKKFISYKYECSSNIIVNSLINLGVNFNKTINGEVIPKISNELYPHFIRGFFDGDGSISLNKNNKSNIYICSINKDFLLNLDKLLYYKNNKIKTSLYIEHRKNNYKTMYKLYIKDRILFFNYLYNNCNYKLERKYEKYNHVNTVLTNKYKKLLVV
jgi:hypothetical protein